MIFSLILVIKKVLGVQPRTILNIAQPVYNTRIFGGGSVIYWFTGASIQAVTTGAYRAVEYIKKNINLDEVPARKRLQKIQKKLLKFVHSMRKKGCSTYLLQYSLLHWHLHSSQHL